jgi:hypothetical protein
VGDSSRPTVSASQGVSTLLQNVGALVAIIVAIGGLIGSGFGYLAAHQADVNKNNLLNLTDKFNQAQQFSQDIEKGRDVLARNDPNKRAIIEYISIYSASNTVGEKFLLVEAAVETHDAQGMAALGDLMAHDALVQEPVPADRASAAAIKATLRSSAVAAVNSAPQPKSSPSARDVPVSAIPDRFAAAGGKIVAALTQTGTVGWIFVGDIPSSAPGATRPLVGDWVNATIVPSAHQTLTAQTSCNIRSAPPAPGSKVGSIIGVALGGSTMEVGASPVRRIPYYSASRRARSQAIWVPVTLRYLGRSTPT